MTSNVKNDSQLGKSIIPSGPWLFAKRLSSSVMRTSMFLSTTDSYVDTIVSVKKGFKALLTFLCRVGSRLENKVYICSPLKTAALKKYISDFKVYDSS